MIDTMRYVRFSCDLMRGRRGICAPMWSLPMASVCVCRREGGVESCVAESCVESCESCVAESCVESCESCVTESCVESCESCVAESCVAESCVAESCESCVDEM